MKTFTFFLKNPVGIHFLLITPPSYVGLCQSVSFPSRKIKKAQANIPLLEARFFTLH